MFAFGVGTWCWVGAVDVVVGGVCISSAVGVVVVEAGAAVGVVVGVG